MLAVIKSPDTDMLIILLYYAIKFHPMVVVFDTGKGANRKIINISDVVEDLAENYCEALPSFHCFTGEDCNSAFKGKGKIRTVSKPIVSGGIRG